MNFGSNMTVPYPIYPPYQGMGMPTILNNDCSNNDLSNLENKLDNLEKRISSIEKYINNLNINNNYNSSNYQML